MSVNIDNIGPRGGFLVNRVNTASNFLTRKFIFTVHRVLKKVGCKSHEKGAQLFGLKKLGVKNHAQLPINKKLTHGFLRKLAPFFLD
jgi:hypothetical protein